MVPLPLFKLAALFVRHISKYGANQIKAQAHEHPRFRAIAARYGQAIHQLNMRTNVALLRNPIAEIKAKEKAETATVQTKEEFEKEQEKKKKSSTSKEHEMPNGDSSKGSGTRPSHFRIFTSQGVWKRKFRPLPEAKAVDLFADVVGDAFILGVAGGLITYESWKALQKPDKNLERIKELDERFDDLERRELALEKEEAELLRKVTILEDAIRVLSDPKTKKPLLPPREPPLDPSPSAVA
ncbi:optic atrophy 3-like protein [Plectosphaerella plurivora]|uniref:Optic atrophy 3-like protein n=1 Tax=Plectosphaerella plurivora TaxID=936078 RepID=A0A9P9AD43_9PEZI|nr:optic atrophy 3-like protein [Plectosphaerella plurivora]